MSSIALENAGPRQAWMDEVRATLALAWPMILTNLLQIALTTTDVVMMGWLGPDALAAGALGSTLYFAFMIFGIGLVTAVAPMVAREVGARRHSVREVRRTVRQGLWSCIAISVPIWAVPIASPKVSTAARSAVRRTAASTTSPVVPTAATTTKAAPRPATASTSTVSRA